MKRMMLDYLRRWWWVLALDGALEFRFGWSIARCPEDNFEFWGLFLALWAGATLLSLDLRRGVLRAVAVLPLTHRQIGHSWWLTTVAVPAAALAALLFLGAGSFAYSHPNQVFPASRLALAAVFNLVWLGAIAAGVFGSMRVSYRSAWELLGASSVSALSALMICGGDGAVPGCLEEAPQAGPLLGSRRGIDHPELGLRRPGEPGPH